MKLHRTIILVLFKGMRRKNAHYSGWQIARKGIYQPVVSRESTLLGNPCCTSLQFHSRIPRFFLCGLSCWSHFIPLAITYNNHVNDFPQLLSGRKTKRPERRSRTIRQPWARWILAVGPTARVPLVTQTPAAAATTVMSPLNPRVNLRYIWLDRLISLSDFIIV